MSFFHQSLTLLGLPDYWNFFKDIMFFKEVRWATFVSVCREGETGIWPLGDWE